MSEMLKGLLEGIILQKIAWGETYGYEITHFLSELGFTDISEGTVYTVLLRLEKKQLLQVDKRPSDKGPVRKFYQLTPAGTDYLNQYWQRWEFLDQTINQLRKDR